MPRPSVSAYPGTTMAATIPYPRSPYGLARVVRATGRPRGPLGVLALVCGFFLLTSFARDRVNVALDTQDEATGLAAVAGISQVEALATIGLGARTARVREAALQRLSESGLPAPPAAGAGRAARLIRTAQAAFNEVPGEHRIRLMAALLPAVELLADPRVAEMVGEIRFIEVAWNPYTMEYAGHTLAGEQFTCTLGLSRSPNFATAVWSTRFPATLTVRSGQVDERFIPAEADMESLMRPVLYRLPQETIAGIARDSREALIRRAAAAVLNDQSLLAVIAREDPHTSVRRIAVERLEDAAVVASVARTEADPGVRLAAVKRLGDQGLLAGIARADDSQEAREMALSLLSEQRLLAQVALADGDPGIRRRAVERLTDNVVLAAVAASGAEPEVRRAAVERLTDQLLLAGIALQDAEEEVRLAAVEKLADQALLARIALGDPSQWVREGAVFNLTDQSLLERIAKEDRNNRVRQAARERLEEARRP